MNQDRKTATRSRYFQKLLRDQGFSNEEILHILAACGSYLVPRKDVPIGWRFILYLVGKPRSGKSVFAHLFSRVFEEGKVLYYDRNSLSGLRPEHIAGNNLLVVHVSERMRFQQRELQSLARGDREIIIPRKAKPPQEVWAGCCMLMMGNQVDAKVCNGGVVPFVFIHFRRSIRDIDPHLASKAESELSLLREDMLRAYESMSRDHSTFPSGWNVAQQWCYEKQP